MANAPQAQPQQQGQAQDQMGAAPKPGGPTQEQTGSVVTPDSPVVEAFRTLAMYVAAQSEQGSPNAPALQAALGQMAQAFSVGGAGMPQGGPETNEPAGQPAAQERPPAPQGQPQGQQQPQGQKSKRPSAPANNGQVPII